MNLSRKPLEEAFAWLAGRRLAVGAAVVVMAALASVVVPRMPLQLLPEVRYPQIRVIGDYPGRTARVVEESVNQPLEVAFAGLEGLVRMESRSGDGRCYIELFFQPGHNLDRALQDVTQGLARARSTIPPEFPDPRVFPMATSEEPVMQIAFSSGVLSVPELRGRVRVEVLPRLRAVRGVEAVFVGREENPELIVDFDPDRLAAAGIDLAAAEQALSEALAPSLNSSIRTPDFEGVGVLGRDDWEPERLARRMILASGDGAAMPLSSVATIRRGEAEESLRARLNGQGAVLVTVHRAPRAQSLRMAREIRAIVADATTRPALAGADATLLFDDSVVTRGAVRSVLVAATAGPILAMLLIVVALRNLRHCWIVALVVIAGLSAAVLVLHALGQSLNLLTLAGLLLSVGMGLDYAIIFFDRLDRVDRGSPAPHATAMADVSGPLFGALVTTLLAVIPFLMVEGVVALLFRPLIVTVAVTAVTTFIFALCILPAFARAAKGPAIAPSARTRPESLWRRRLWTGGGALAMAAALIVGPRWLPFEVLPVVDDGFVDVRLAHPAGITQGGLDLLTRRVEFDLLDVPGTEALFTTVGGYFREGLPSFRPATSTFMVRVNFSDGGGSSAAWAAAARRAVAGLEAPGLRLSITLPRIRGVQTRLAEADVIVVLTRPDGDLLALGEVERQVTEVMQRVVGLTDVERLRGGVSPRWRIEPDEVSLAAHGVRDGALRRTIEYTLEGRVLRQRMDRGEPLAVRGRFVRDASGPDGLNRARLPGNGGASVQLGDVAQFALIEEPTHIERREQQRVVRVAAQLDPAGPGPAAVVARLEQELNAEAWPDGVSWWLEGEMQALEETRRTFGLALTLALLLVFAWLLVQFGRWSFSIAAMMVIPLGGGAAFVLLGLFGRALDAMVLAGLLIAIGVMTNNVILVLTQAAEAANNGGGTLATRLRQAGRDRLRPVLLTTLSTVLGMAPLMFGGGREFALLQPLAFALTGALLGSVFLSCYVLPEIAAWLSRERHRGRP